MQYRRLGKTGWNVSAISLGCWIFGVDWWGHYTEDRGVELCKFAQDQGVTFFDNGDAYGNGRAETILGQSGATIPAYAGLQQPWLDANPDMNAQVFIDALAYAQRVPDPPVGYQWQVDLQGVVIDGFAGNIPADEIGAKGAAAATAAL